uniref:Uncharacterized protein n=1 Tax=Brassica oleracea TaxID=3712 RepID=A0A3P6D1T2_BRAOL|nr:unnamed protein product [Brassica oleracea]
MLMLLLIVLMICAVFLSIISNCNHEFAVFSQRSFLLLRACTFGCVS